LAFWTKKNKYAAAMEINVRRSTVAPFAPNSFNKPIMSQQTMAEEAFKKTNNMRASINRK
jgi:hypothetical protein